MISTHLESVTIEDLFRHLKEVEQDSDVSYTAGMLQFRPKENRIPNISNIDVISRWAEAHQGSLQIQYFLGRIRVYLCGMDLPISIKQS